MSRDLRDRYYERDRNRSHHDWDMNDYRSRHSTTYRKRDLSPRRREEKRRSRSPNKHDKDNNILDDNILSEISKLPEPSELWDNQNVQDGSFPAPPPPRFDTDVSQGNADYRSNYQDSYTNIYRDFPSTPAPPPAPDASVWNQMALPPPLPAPASFVPNVEDQIKKEAAIETEMRHQKAALSKQREDYIKKAGILKKELETLKDQRSELRGDSKRSPSPDTKRFLKENTKLQLEIQNKLKTINNVVDMLNGIIGEEALVEKHDSEGSEHGSKRKSRSPSAGKKFNYVYYDPEMHWCRVCNEFPATAKDYLNHLHSPPHQKMASAHLEAPWHSISGINDGFPNYPSAPTKRTPIRGLQFFVPSTAWYCKLCDQFIGDLHCASAHLKSVVHSKNYTNFVEQNPHWETDWMSDRQKAIEKSRVTKIKSEKIDEKALYAAHTITFDKDGFHTKRKGSPNSNSEDKRKKKEKKKKTKRKRSSSSGSSSSSSSENESVKKKKNRKEKKQDEEDRTLKEWMSSMEMGRLDDNDRKLLDTLKSRIKADKEEAMRRPAERTADRQRAVVQLQTKNREPSRDIKIRENRDARSDSRRREERNDNREERREERERRTGAGSDIVKKPETKKMPFIGKMPVFKNMTKQKEEEKRKEEEKKKGEEDESTKKKKEELDAEIQRKVAEFKEKIAKAQLEREQAAAAALPPPALVLPTGLTSTQTPPQFFLPPLAPAPTPGSAPTPGPARTPGPAPTPVQYDLDTKLSTVQDIIMSWRRCRRRSKKRSKQKQISTPQPQGPNLPQDFQDALDIIFPSEAKKAEVAQQAQQDLFTGMTSGLPPGFTMGPFGNPGGVMPSFPHLGMMDPNMMMGFNLNSQLFTPRPQLYDTQVPIMPNNKPQQRQSKNTSKRQNNINQLNQNENNQRNSQSNAVSDAQNKTAAQKDIDKKREELDDLAMLGIDATDVGAGI